MKKKLQSRWPFVIERINFTARDFVPRRRVGRSLLFGTAGERMVHEVRRASFPGLKARPFEPAFQAVSQLYGSRFQKRIRIRPGRVYNLPEAGRAREGWTELFGCAPSLILRLLELHGIFIEIPPTPWTSFETSVCFHGWQAPGFATVA